MQSQLDRAWYRGDPFATCFGWQFRVDDEMRDGHSGIEVMVITKHFPELEVAEPHASKAIAQRVVVIQERMVAQPFQDALAGVLLARGGQQLGHARCSPQQTGQREILILTLLCQCQQRQSAVRTQYQE